MSPLLRALCHVCDHFNGLRVLKNTLDCFNALRDCPVSMIASFYTPCLLPRGVLTSKCDFCILPRSRSLDSIPLLFIHCGLPSPLQPSHLSTRLRLTISTDEVKKKYFKIQANHQASQEAKYTQDDVKRRKLDTAVSQKPLHHLVSRSILTHPLTRHRNHKGLPQ